MAPLTEASAAALLEEKRYDAAILPQLEEYVHAQCKGGTYDLDCNLAVLKLYQFHPELSKTLPTAKEGVQPMPTYLQMVYC